MNVQFFFRCVYRSLKLCYLGLRLADKFVQKLPIKLALPTNALDSFILVISQFSLLFC